MKNAFVFLCCLATTLLIAPIRAAADDVPRMCSDAQAMFDNAHRYTNDSNYSQWDIELLYKAEKTFAECQIHATTPHIVAVGAFGRMRSFIDLGIYGLGSARYAKVFAHGNDVRGRKNFTELRRLALASFGLAKEIIEAMNRANPGVYEDEEYKTLDDIYANYKFWRERAANLTYENTPKTFAEAERKASEQRKAHAVARARSSEEKVSCAVPDADAATTQAAEPDYPDIARQQGAVGTAKVKVSLDATGHILEVSLAKSSGNASLDQSALKAAQASTYAPQVVNCKNTASEILFTADFTGQ